MNENMLSGIRQMLDEEAAGAHPNSSVTIIDLAHGDQDHLKRVAFLIPYLVATLKAETAGPDNHLDITMLYNEVGDALRFVRYYQLGRHKFDAVVTNYNRSGTEIDRVTFKGCMIDTINFGAELGSFTDDEGELSLSLNVSYSTWE